MDSTLSDLFMETKGGPVLINNIPTLMAVKYPIRNGQRLNVSFLYYDNHPRQGIELSVDNNKGNIEVNGQIINRPVFWTDTAPKEFEIKCIPKGQSGFVHIWNIWQFSATKTIHAWTGNAGIQVDENTPGAIVLNCSNGLCDVNFSNIVIRINIG
jgi:hypothetical protein